MPGGSFRLFMAYAKRHHEHRAAEGAMRVPMPETETDLRAARIPGWRTLKLGKYSTEHTMEDRKRFE